jgi:hypothetical protein
MVKISYAVMKEDFRNFGNYANVYRGRSRSDSEVKNVLSIAVNARL